MPEWLVERGIGETRAVLVEGGEIVEARILLDGAIAAGTVLEARLVDHGRDGRNAIARDRDGNDYLLPRGAAGVAQGSALIIEVTREAIPGAEPWKRPLAKATNQVPAPPPPPPGRDIPFPGASDELGQAGWNDLIDEARSGIIAFAGGELRISPTPAMTLIDVDGYLPPAELAVAGAAAAARALRRLDIGGSIGIDLPTTATKSARHAAAAAIDALLPKPFERTAANGFGFLQIVRPRRRASLPELAHGRASFEARALLRRVALDKPGPKRLVVHPALGAVLDAHRDWLDALSRQLGGAVSLRSDPALPISAGHAEPF